jgi:transcriptional regulator with XRE-family HTH domain
VTNYEKRQRLSDLLREYQEKRNWSGYELARALQVSQPSVVSWVSTSGFPSEESRRKIAATLGISYAELMAKLEGSALAPSRPVESILQEIRVMAPADFGEVVRAVGDRLVQDSAKLAEQDSSVPPTPRKKRNARQP